MWESSVVGTPDRPGRVAVMRGSARRHPGVVALALLAVCTGIGLLLARSYHFGAAVLVAGVLVGLPALFVGVRAIPGDAPGLSRVDLAPLVDQISQAIARPGGCRASPARATAAASSIAGWTGGAAEQSARPSDDRHSAAPAARGAVWAWRRR